MYHLRRDHFGHNLQLPQSTERPIAQGIRLQFSNPPLQITQAIIMTGHLLYDRHIARIRALNVYKNLTRAGVSRNTAEYSA
jgi:hypothetical protein